MARQNTPILLNSRKLLINHKLNEFSRIQRKHKLLNRANEVLNNISVQCDVMEYLLRKANNI